MNYDEVVHGPESEDDDQSGGSDHLSASDGDESDYSSNISIGIRNYVDFDDSDGYSTMQCKVIKCGK